jgi:hypothetical protein
MRELFIYYQVPTAEADRARTAVEAFQQRLRQRFPRLIARLLRRPEEAKGLQTWMEVYALPGAPDSPGVTEPIEAAIAIEAKNLEGLIAGGRHIEVFVPCAS